MTTQASDFNGLSVLGTFQENIYTLAMGPLKRIWGLFGPLRSVIPII